VPRRRISLTRVPGSSGCATATISQSVTLPHPKNLDFQPTSSTRRGPITGIWGKAVKEVGFDGIHWDTLGRKAGVPRAEDEGTGEFLRRAKESLAALGLSQTLNFVDLAWWKPDFAASGLVEFPYAEVWSDASKESYYTAMDNPALAGTWGVMAFYSTDFEVMLGRWAEAPKHRLMYLILGDNEKRLVGPYFPAATPLSPSEKATMAASLPVFP